MAELGYNAVVEFVEETEFATFPTDPTMQWIGLVTRFKPVDVLTTNTIRYFGDEDQTDNRLENLANLKIGREVGFEISYVPQTLPGFLQYWLGSVSGLSDNVKTISVGIIDKNVNKYTKIMGLLGNEVTLTVPESGEVTIEGNFVGAEIETSDADYVSNGAHATVNESDGLTNYDLTSVQMDSGGGYQDLTDYVNSLSLSIRNTIGIFRDLASTRSTKIGALKVVSREVTLTLELDYEDYTMLENVRNFTSNNVKFTLGGKTFELTGVRFPEVPFEYTPDDLIGDTITSLPVTGLTIA